MYKMFYVTLFEKFRLKRLLFRKKLIFKYIIFFIQFYFYSTYSSKYYSFPVYINYIKYITQVNIKSFIYTFINTSKINNRLLLSI